MCCCSSRQLVFELKPVAQTQSAHWALNALRSKPSNSLYLAAARPVLYCSSFYSDP